MSGFCPGYSHEKRVLLFLLYL